MAELATTDPADLAEIRTKPSLRYRLIRPVAAAVRLYLARFPLKKGKSFVLVHVLSPLLPPPPQGYIAVLPGGAQVRMQYREVIGLATFVNGFEAAELQLLSVHATNGSTAVDVGANIGVFSLPLSTAVGDSGKVLAFEPHPANLRRLAANVQLNSRNNVEMFPFALGATRSRGTLHLGNDPAYHSLATVAHGRETGADLSVPVFPLDEIWEEKGSPWVSVIKIDVEGSELSVLLGAEKVISTCTPVLLVESNDEAQRAEIAAWLEVRGYAHSRPNGFAPWNALYLPR